VNKLFQAVLVEVLSCSFSSLSWELYEVFRLLSGSAASPGYPGPKERAGAPDIGPRLRMKEPSWGYSVREGASPDYIDTLRYAKGGWHGPNGLSFKKRPVSPATLGTL
jgi:hypothetical protein